MNNENANESLRSRFISMNVGDTMLVDLKDYTQNTVRNYASDLGFVMERKYVARRVRGTRTLEIRRTA